MGYIVTINGERHSYWTSYREAKVQKEILENNNYGEIELEYKDTDYNNGHHFV